MPNLFISYPREYRPTVEKLVDDLRSGGYQPYFDEQLAGGQQWWSELLRRIENASAFLPILGSGYLNSGPCNLEARYAADLGKPFLPIAVENVPPQLFPEVIARAHWAEYDPAQPGSVLRVIRAINGLPPAPPLPNPMPAPPQVPISYMTALQNEVSGDAEISRARQLVIIADLKNRLRTVDRDAAIMLLRKLRERQDIVYQAAVDVDETFVREGLAIEAGRSPIGPTVNQPSQPPSNQPQQQYQYQPPPNQQQHRPQPPSQNRPQQAQPHQVPPGQPPYQQPQSPVPSYVPVQQEASGQYPAAQPGQHMPMPLQKPSNHLVWTILTCVLFCIPLGIVGIVYSSRVDRLWSAGNYQGAMDASHKAKMWAIISFVAGIFLILVLIGIGSGSSSS